MSDSCDPIDCCSPGSSVCGISQTRTLEWVAISSSRGSSQSRHGTRVYLRLLHRRRVLVCWATGEGAQGLVRFHRVSTTGNCLLFPLWVQGSNASALIRGLMSLLYLLSCWHQVLTFTSAFGLHALSLGANEKMVYLGLMGRIWEVSSFLRAWILPRSHPHKRVRFSLFSERLCLSVLFFCHHSGWTHSLRLDYMYLEDMTNGFVITSSCIARERRTWRPLSSLLSSGKGG